MGSKTSKKPSPKPSITSAPNSTKQSPEKKTSPFERFCPTFLYSWKFISSNFKKLRFGKLFTPYQEQVSIWVLSLGISLILAGLIASIREDFIAPVLISLGAGIVTVYISEGIRNMMASIPRQESVHRIGLLHQNLAGYLYRHNSDWVPHVEIEKHLKTTRGEKITQKNFGLFLLMRQLENIIINDKNKFLSRLKIHQLKSIEQELRGIEA